MSSFMKASIVGRLSVFVLVVLAYSGAQAQTITATIPVGTAPRAVGVNPVTSKVYVASAFGGSVTVIDGATQATTNVAYGTSPYALAVNPVTDKIYVANGSSNDVTVIDGATNAVAATVPTGIESLAIALNPVTNKIYVANSGSGDITVIDGATNSTFTVAAGTYPSAVAVNPATNKIYVVNTRSNNVTVIDGSTNTTDTVAAGTQPDAVAVNPATNRIYVTNGGSNDVTVIDGMTDSTTTIASGIKPVAVAVNPASNRIYVANANPCSNLPCADGSVTMIDGATQGTSMFAVGVEPAAVAVDPLTRQIYVANRGNNTITVIDGGTGSTTTLNEPSSTGPYAVGINPISDKIYVVNIDTQGNSVTVIDGATDKTATVDVGATPLDVAVNPVSNKIYAADQGSNDVTVIDGSTDTVATTVAVGSGPSALAVNPITSKIYVANGDYRRGNTVTVIDGETDTVVATVGTGTNPVAMAVNPVTNKIYVANQGVYNNPGNTVTVIDGATNSPGTVTVGISPVDIAINQVTNKIYVVNGGDPSAFPTPPGTITVIDGETDTVVATVGIGNQPGSVTVNPVTNKVYVADKDAATGNTTITVVDGSTDTVASTVTLSNTSGPVLLASNPVTNRIYIASDVLTVIDGATDSIVDTVSYSAISPTAVALNRATNKIYVPNQGNGSVTVIDGITDKVTDVVVPVGSSLPGAEAVNPISGKVYIARPGGNNVAVLIEQMIQAIPLEASITPLPGNVSGSLTPGFDFTTSSSFSPDTTAPDALRFQADTWQNQWTGATNNGSGNFTGQTPTLQIGLHILYAYATDGQEATSVNTGSQSAPLVGNITAYEFLIAPAPRAAISPASIDFSTQIVRTTSTAQTVTVSDSGGPLTISGITTSGDFAVDALSSTCSTATPLFADSSCVIALIFAPTTGGAQTGTLTITDNNQGINGSTQTVALSGIGQDFSISAQTASNTISAGGTASYTLQLSPEGGFSGDISLVCSGAPSYSTCSVSPGSVMLNGTDSATVTLKVTTTAASWIPPFAPYPPALPHTALWVGMIALLGFGAFRLFTQGPPRIRPARLASLAIVLLSVAFWASCGGGGSSVPSGAPPPTGTQAGTYTLTVTGTSGSLSHSTNVSLKVQ